ncbi:MAG: N-formylglutamate amidohydrolase [Ilumatobacter sp.]
MDRAQIDWIPEGTSFGEADITFFAGKTQRSLDDALAEVDLIITGPHASAAFPEELAPFVDTRFTKRLQFDFTDVSTSPIARRWAEIDPHVLYIEDPHPRAVRDANRERPDDLVAGLKEAFARLESAGEGGRPLLTGIDAIRPVTFGYLPVYRRPADDSEWTCFHRALVTAGALGVDAYERIRDGLIERVIEAKLAHLAALDPAATSLADWSSATHLDVLSIHDTMNHTARPDGAICVEREPPDRLPNVVALSNRGDGDGEVSPDSTGALRDPVEVPTMRPDRLRSIARAYRTAFDAHAPDDVAFNRPYRGGYETRLVGPRLRDLEPRSVVRTGDGPVRRLRLGAWQNEFLREFLLGADATAALKEPGREWTTPSEERIDWIAHRLRAAHDLVRSW